MGVKDARQSSRREIKASPACEKTLPGTFLVRSGIRRQDRRKIYRERLELPGVMWAAHRDVRSGKTAQEPKRTRLRRGRSMYIVVYMLLWPCADSAVGGVFVPKVMLIKVRKGTRAMSLFTEALRMVRVMLRPMAFRGLCWRVCVCGCVG